MSSHLSLSEESNREEPNRSVHHALGTATTTTKGIPAAEDRSDGKPTIGAWSEVGTLREVLVCAPGLAHQRLTPRNCHDLLFDEML